jgi:transglutaminase-like putative cysteine protease
MATLARTMPTSRPDDSGHVAEVVTLVLHAVLVLSVVAGMRRVDGDDRNAILAPLAVAGLIAGYLLARTRAQDMVAHMVALWMGGAASVFIVTVATEGASGIVESRGVVFVDLARSVTSAIYRDRTEKVDDTELVVVLGVTAWLLAYCSAWVIYRRGWFLLGIAVPAAILLASIRADDRSGGWPLSFFSFAAIAMATRHALAANSVRWARKNMSAGTNLTQRFLFSGLPVAVVAVIIAAALNPAFQDSVSRSPSEQLTERWDELRNRVAELIGSRNPDTGRYPSFPDEFDLGGNIDLGEEVVARVRSDDDNYLALRRYDTYEDNGWSSRVDETFRMDGDTEDIRVTSIIFNADQDVAISGDVMTDRVPENAIITVFRPKDDLIFTIETFSSASRQILGVMSWRQLDEEEIDVERSDVLSLPVELQAIVKNLRGDQFDVDNDSGEVSLADSTAEKEYEDEAKKLNAYPVETELRAGDDGRLLLVATGRLPNYDDIEALFTSSTLEPGSDYRVIGLASGANPPDLASASTDYPTWLANRYLQLPDSVTERTRSAATSIVIDADASNPFDMAQAVQDFLRSNYTYELNGPETPGGQDYVDYFLFDHKAGRCEQFATAMVVLVRSLGIPARLVSGYNFSPDQREANGDVLYRESQAHTWVEVYFPGYGWIPFEPTTNLAPFQFSEDQPAEGSEPPDGQTGTPEAEPSPEPTTRATPDPQATPDVPALAIEESDSSPGAGGIALMIAGVLAAGAVGLGSLLALRWRWRLRGLSPASGLFARLQRIGGWFGVRPGDATTPNEFGRALTRVLPGSDAAVRSITTAYYVEQFDPEGAGGETLVSARNGWRQLRSNLLRWRLRKRRR